MLETLGPAYISELRRTPDDPDGAWTRAKERTWISAAGTAGGWAAFNKFNLARGPLENMVGQFLGVQPAVSALTGAGQDVVSGASPEDMAQHALINAYHTVMGGVPLALTGTAHTIFKHYVGGKPPEAPITPGRTKAVADNLYKAALGTDPIPNPQAVTQVKQNVKNGMLQARLRPEWYDQLYQDVDKLDQPLSNQPLSMTDVHNVRNRIGKYIGANSGDDRRAGVITRNLIDQHTADEQSLQNMGFSPQEARAQSIALQGANQQWHNWHNLDELHGILREAGQREGAPKQLGHARASFDEILQDPERLKMYPKDVQDLMNKIVNDSPNKVERVLEGFKLRGGLLFSLMAHFFNQKTLANAIAAHTVGSEVVSGLRQRRLWAAANQMENMMAWHATEGLRQTASQLRPGYQLPIQPAPAPYEFMQTHQAYQPPLPMRYAAPFIAGLRPTAQAPPPEKVARPMRDIYPMGGPQARGGAIGQALKIARQ